MTKIRQYYYLASGAIAGILPLLVGLGVIDASKSESLTQVVLALGSLLGAGVGVTAGSVLAKQRKDGTVGSAPAEPVDVVVQAIPQVIEKAAKAQADLERLKTAAAEAIGNVPVYGDDAKAIIDALPNF
ncbi:holin [Mycobacterium phage Myxus]|uniref:Holin n=7 Tax=Fromanvirus TaxID=186764 RepID=G1BR18_9CAUD|nr:holin [Mycobacterium phage Pioneer]YP_009301834.1 holin [Mycobacterium phage Catalina]YP_009635982.1 holin [Mycobacterium phage PackMan]AMO43880.1 holin [Mycobacterium phage Myxus]AOQ28969.1 holin [Mycobacterium phage HortumSL17]AOT26131.1 holin [Mycobacterium phage Qobbit]AOY12095.1 holin [Mycobacterium phage Phaeder]AVI03719.1 holin [Mycobacterium phage Conquerage]AVI04227.1 holin [Mycobacterium phage Phonnegut]AVI04443.1 holin [Mycobacterium phage Scherzo]AZF93491.1 holin [Mycobacte